MSKRTSYSKLMKRPHLGATRMLGYALTSHDYETWGAASAVWQARLTPDECGALAWAALRSLDPDQARDVAEAALGGVGMPIAPLLSEIDAAAFWADMASPEELEAYCLATFNAMPRDRQAAFLDYVQGRKAA